jgi:hypothetical protein
VQLKQEPEQKVMQEEEEGEGEEEEEGVMHHKY